jgi:chaperone required for assembly of F1-ATPase
MKRFYKQAAAAAQDEVFSIMLDGRPVRTPGKGFLHLPTQGLAEAIAAEWSAQAETIEPATMPLTQLASTAIDRVASQKQAVAAEIARYAETDLVCYRAEGPESLVQRQRDIWTPLLDWLAAEYSARLDVTAGIRPVQQPADAIAAVREAVASFGYFRLAGLSSATSSMGSVVIGLALTAGRISAQEAADAAFIDEKYQMEQWGNDPEEEARLSRLRSDLEAVERFLALLP